MLVSFRSPGFIVILGFLILMMMSSCSPRTGPAPRWENPDNLLTNPSFENGRDPWKSLTDSSPFWRDFEIADTVAHSGRHSARLPLDSLRQNDSGTWVWGVVRDFESLDHLPKTLSGHFRVHRWQQGTHFQYLQVAVLLFPKESGFPKAFDDPTVPLQVAWVLAGIDRPPFPILNRKFVFAGPLEVPQDRWIPFEFDLTRDFFHHWGFVPEDFSKLRILFEARYDGWQLGQGEVSGDVFFDDLYLGDQPLEPEN